ncbi:MULTISPECIES: DUF742 domain-containing protein [unclassified Micromonospora]|uniref:DUF742 domain-containing protein n=1 Tax=unclassified Micromonospora TaxID=2617518 RepID=UPI003635FA83
MTTTCPAAPPGHGPAIAGSGATGLAATGLAATGPGAAGPAAPATGSAGAADGSDALMRALDALVDRVPGAHVAVLLAPDGLRLGASRGTEEAVAERVSGMVAGLWALGAAAARLCDDVEARQIVTRMAGVLLHITGVRTGVVLALHTSGQTRAADIECEVARFVTEADRHLPARPTPPPVPPGPGPAHPTPPPVPPGPGPAHPTPGPVGPGPAVRAGSTAPCRARTAPRAPAGRAVVPPAPPAPGAPGSAAESRHLDLASLVLARPGTGRLPRLTPEQARIIRRCRHPLSVAEIATDLDLPVGAVRGLLDGLRRAGLVEVRDLPSHGGRPSMEVLERLLTALRAL